MRLNEELVDEGSKRRTRRPAPDIILLGSNQCVQHLRRSPDLAEEVKMDLGEIKVNFGVRHCDIEWMVCCEMKQRPDGVIVSW